MIKIAICDDDLTELNKTKDMCNKYVASHSEYDISINSFTSPKELINHITQQGQFDIMLLDIYMPDITGIELARILRERNEECQIIFLTTSQIHAVEAFSLHAAHYLVKPYSSDLIDEALSKAILAVNKNKKAHIILKTSGGVHKIYFPDIIYTETERHLQKIHLIGGKSLQIRISCSELYEILSGDNRFFKCGSTYIINLGKIEEVTTRHIMFENAQLIPMQRRQFKELLDRYTRYSLEGN